MQGQLVVQAVKFPADRSILNMPLVTFQIYPGIMSICLPRYSNACMTQQDASAEEEGEYEEEEEA